MKTVRVAAAIILHNNRIFATQRGYGEFKDGWEFPGGKMEAGETAEHAIVREIEEELRVISGDLVLKEHEAARWLTRKTLRSVDWLPADIGLVEKLASLIY